MPGIFGKRAVFLIFILQCFFSTGQAGCAIAPDEDGHVNIPTTWTSIGEKAFEQCNSLISVDIPESVKEIGHGAFRNCSLESIRIPNSVTYLGGSVFSYAERLATAIIGDGVKSVLPSTFRHCTRLKTVPLERRSSR